MPRVLLQRCTILISSSIRSPRTVDRQEEEYTMNKEGSLVPPLFYDILILGIHSRGELRTDANSLLGKYVDPACVNEAVSLDGHVAKLFLRNIVVPRLQQNIV